MLVRKSKAVWEGNLPKGKGIMELSSGHLKLDYSFSSRFENGLGTNPEELIAAAHAGCFSMALSAILAGAGFNPEQVATTAHVGIDKAGDGFEIKSIKLITEAIVPGITDADFMKYANEAKTGCPVSKALAAVPSIELEAKLIG